MGGSWFCRFVRDGEEESWRRGFACANELTSYLYICTGSHRRREGWRGVPAVSTGGGARNRAERIFRVTRIALVPSTRFSFSSTGTCITLARSNPLPVRSKKLLCEDIESIYIYMICVLVAMSHFETMF